MGADDPLDTISGTTGLTGCADGILILKRERRRHDAALLAFGRDLEDAELALKWDPLITWSLMAGTASEYRQSLERQAILAELAQHAEPIAPKALALALGKSDGSIRFLLSEMARAGEILSPARGLYTSPNNANELTRGDPVIARALELFGGTPVRVGAGP